ncbi:MAG: ATP-binding protein [Acidobacteriota bacterium]
MHTLDIPAPKPDGFSDRPTIAGRQPTIEQDRLSTAPKHPLARVPKPYGRGLLLVALLAFGSALVAIWLAPRGGWWAPVAALTALTLTLVAVGRWLRLQRRIRAVASEWQLTIDAVADPILTLDPDGRILRMNRAAMRLSGKPYTENLGKTISDLGAGEPWRTASQRLTQAQKGHRTTVPIKDLDSGQSWEITVSKVHNPERERPTIIAVARNVTEIVDLQESLHRQELMAATGSLVAGVAHDMRNFLVAVNGTAHLIEQSAGHVDNVPRLVRLLREHGDRTNALMQTLLDYGKPIEKTHCEESITELVEEACRICTSAAQAKDVKLTIRCAPDLPRIACDRTRILQAFTNLVENAVQHSPTGGEVIVETRWAGRSIECLVRDSGPGFAAADLERIFEPFFTRRQGGTGLGLAIVHRVISEHGGEIVATNHPAGGALFRLELPARLTDFLRRAS